MDTRESLSGTPVRWNVVFATSSKYWWAQRLPGRFKHVKAFGYSLSGDCWLFFDPALRTTVSALSGDAAKRTIERWTGSGATLVMPACNRARVRFLPFCCTTAVASLLGLPGGALLPVHLYRQCLRNGAQILNGQT